MGEVLCCQPRLPHPARGVLTDDADRVLARIDSERGHSMTECSSLALREFLGITLQESHLRPAPGQGLQVPRGRLLAGYGDPANFIGDSRNGGWSYAAGGATALGKLRETRGCSIREFVDDRAAYEDVLSKERKRWRILCRQKRQSYRPLLEHIPPERLSVHPNVSDKELDTLRFIARHSRLNRAILRERHELLSESAEYEDYAVRLDELHG